MWHGSSLFRRDPAVALLLVVGLLAGCAEGPAGPVGIPPDPAASAGGRGFCAAADVTVGTFGELSDALATAAPGTTIAVAGTIPLEGDIGLPAGVTLTCAKPGAGLTVAPGSEASWLLNLRAPDAGVVGLHIDATGANGGAIFVFWDGVDAFGERPRILNNRARCGGSGQNECIVLLGGLESFAVAGGGTIAGNHVEGPDASIGIHVQGFFDVQVERNVVTTPIPRPGGGIAVNLSRDVSVRENVVTGPWLSGIQLFDNAIRVELYRNRVRGATEFPIRVESADAARVIDNHAECGDGGCVFVDASTNTLVSGNHFQAAGPVTGVHAQGGIDGTRILDNRVLTTAPSSDPNLGGIRVRDGADVTVAGNIVEGPWANGIAVDGIAEATIERNRLLRPAGFGLSLALDGSTIGGNRVANAALGGLRLRSGCFNAFTGNILVGNDPGALFDPPTGANTYDADPSPVVDLGAFDCDGDGVDDPNRISTAGASASAAAVPPAPATSGNARGLR